VEDVSESCGQQVEEREFRSILPSHTARALAEPAPPQTLARAAGPNLIAAKPVSLPAANTLPVAFHATAGPLTEGARTKRWTFVGPAHGRIVARRGPSHLTDVVGCATRSIQE